MCGQRGSRKLVLDMPLLGMDGVRCRASELGKASALGEAIVRGGLVCWSSPGLAGLILGEGLARTGQARLVFELGFSRRNARQVPGPVYCHGVGRHFTRFS